MAKILRPAATIPPFGSGAAAADLKIFGTATESTDLAALLTNANAIEGWAGGVDANGFPALEWFNAIGFTLSSIAAVYLQDGISKWDVNQEYYVDSYCVGSDGKQYKSLTGTPGTPNPGTTNPGDYADPTNWERAAALESELMTVNNLGIKGTPRIADGSDLNTHQTTGHYEIVLTSATNKPAGVTGGANATLTVLRSNRTDIVQVTQQLNMITDNRVFTRAYNSVTWTAWLELGTSTGPLLAEFEVTGAAVTSIDFSGLDISVEKSYRIEMDWKNEIASTSMYLYVNNDTTATNYYYQYLAVQGTSVSGARTTSPRIGAALTTVPAPMQINGIVQLVDGIFSYTGISSQENAANVGFFQWAVKKIATVANITQLTLVATNANAIGIGTKVRIYRGDV